MLPPREPRGVAARHSPRIAVRVAPHSRPAAGARKAALELALTPDRPLLLPSTGHRVVATRCLDKRGPQLTLPPAEPLLVRIGRNSRAENGATGLPHMGPYAGRTLLTPPV